MINKYLPTQFAVVNLSLWEIFSLEWNLFIRVFILIKLNLYFDSLSFFLLLFIIIQSLITLICFWFCTQTLLCSFLRWRFLILDRIILIIFLRNLVRSSFMHIIHINSLCNWKNIKLSWKDIVNIIFTELRSHLIYILYEICLGLILFKE